MYQKDELNKTESSIASLLTNPFLGNWHLHTVVPSLKCEYFSDAVKVTKNCCTLYRFRKCIFALLYICTTTYVHSQDVFIQLHLHVSYVTYLSHYKFEKKFLVNERN